MGNAGKCNSTSIATPRGFIMRRLLVTTFLVAGSSLSWLAVAEVPERLLVGRAAIIQNLVHAKDSKDTRRINLQDVLFFKDQMITSEAAKTVVEFRDGSTLEMGENAVMTIDEMVFNPTDNTNNKSVTLVSGTFRFVSGFASSNAKVEFHTAAATIGIRGCVMAAVVDSDPNRATFVEIAQGQATITNKFGTVDLKNGQATSVSGVQAPGKPNSVPTGLVAAALTKVNKQLGASPSSLPAATPTMQDQTAHANAVATKTQFAIAAATANAPAPIIPTGSAAVFPELDQAAKIGLLAIAPGAPRSDAQKALEAQINKAYPNAPQIVASFDSTNRKANLDNERRATTLVVTGIAKVAPDQVGPMIKAIAIANPTLVVTAAAAATKILPDAAVQIATNAVEAAPDLANQVTSVVSRAAPAAATAVAQASALAVSQATALASRRAEAQSAIDPVMRPLVTAINAALNSGDTTQLHQILQALVAADPSKAGAIASVATKAIAAAVKQGLTGGGAIEAAVTDATISTLIAAAPAAAGDILAAAQADLPDDLQTVAIAAAQSSLAPAAGGATAATDAAPTAANFQTASATIQSTAEVPRQSTASPH